MSDEDLIRRITEAPARYVFYVDVSKTKSDEEQDD